MLKSSQSRALTFSKSIAGIHAIEVSLLGENEVGDDSLSTNAEQRVCRTRKVSK
jgi:hypothetical protein